MSRAPTSNTLSIQQLAGTPFSERSGVLEALVVAEFRTTLLMQESDLLPLDESYFELGLTSLGAMEIRQRLEAALGCRIDSASLFNNPTVGRLLDYLRTDVLREFFGARSATEPRGARLSMGSVPTTTLPGVERSPPMQVLSDVLKDLYES